MNHAEARKLAFEFVAQVNADCARCEIAGSVRRRKPEGIKDIEIVAIGKREDRPFYNLFRELAGVIEEVDLLTGRLLELRDWEPDPVLRRWGSRYKRLRHVATGTPLDLFITDATRWGAIFAIRTGPAEFSRELVTRARRLGMQVDGGQLWRVHRDGTRSVVPTPEEADFFAALRVPYLEPWARTIDALRTVPAHRIGSAEGGAE